MTKSLNEELNEIKQSIKDIEKDIEGNMKKQITMSIYCISCFNYNIFKNDRYYLDSINPEVVSIETLNKDSILYTNFIVSIHKINLNEKIKKINLILKAKNSQKYWNLNEFNIKPDKDIVLFVNLEINANYLSDLINDLKNHDLENKDKENNLDNIKVNKILKPSEKLIYI